MLEAVFVILGIFLLMVIFAVLSVIVLTRPREMREDQNRENGEFDGHIVVKDWNKEK